MIKTAIAVQCPKCGAKIGDGCTRADGRDYRKHGRLARHVERIQAWNAAGRPHLLEPTDNT